MKRWIALWLALVQCCLLLACGETPAGEPARFTAGLSKCDISPKVSLPLDGYSSTNDAQYRWSDFVEKPLYATCTAITDEKAQTMLLITSDMLHATMADFKPVKNGFYTFEAMDEKGNKPMLLIKDLQVAEKILSVESAQYLFDEQNVIVDIVR